MNTKTNEVMLLLLVLTSILILVTGTITIYQELTGKIDPRTGSVIILSLIVVQLIINAVRGYVSTNRDARIGMDLLLSAKVMVPRGEFINLNVKPETNLYKKDIVATNTLHKKKCVFIVEIEIGEFKEAPVLLLSSMYHSKTDIHKLNKGMGLSNGVSYMFNIVAKSGEYINFKFNSGGIVKKFAVNEYYIP